jgi:hypothetical protein
MDRTLEIWLVFGGIIIAIAAFAYWLQSVFRRQRRDAAVGAIKQGQNVFLTWNYPPEDWKAIAEENFEIKPRRLGENGKASFTKRHVYVTNGSDDILFELVGEDRYVKHLTDVYIYKQTERNVLRFEVRSKYIKKDDNGHDTMEEEYETETFYAPVPKGSESDGEKVLAYYKNLLDKNADAIAAVMPFGLGIFKK